MTETTTHRPTRSPGRDTPYVSDDGSVSHIPLLNTRDDLPAFVDTVVKIGKAVLDGGPGLTYSFEPYTLTGFVMDFWGNAISPILWNGSGPMPTNQGYMFTRDAFDEALKAHPGLVEVQAGWTALFGEPFYPTTDDTTGTGQLDFLLDPVEDVDPDSDVMRYQFVARARPFGYADVPWHSREVTVVRSTVSLCGRHAVQLVMQPDVVLLDDCASDSPCVVCRGRTVTTPEWVVLKPTE